MIHKTHASNPANDNPPPPPAPDVVEERVPVRLQDQAKLLAGDPLLLTDEQEKELSDYAVRAGMTVEQARAELIRQPRRTVVAHAK